MKMEFDYTRTPYECSGACSLRCVRAFRIELQLTVLVFEERGKHRVPGEKPLGARREQE